MSPLRKITGLLGVAMLIAMLNMDCDAQVMVDKKNINDDKDLKYIQLMYFVDKSSFKPIFYVDYGLIEPEYTDILEPERDYRQKIHINGELVNDRVTVVWLLNKMDKAGWEYMGDVVYLPMKAMDNWHVFTLKRKDVSVATSRLD